MTEQSAQATAEAVQIVNFRLGDEEFGVDITSVREITRVANITRIPESSSFIQGVMNLRGQVIAVIDLAKRFGIPPREELSASARIVVTEIGRHTSRPSIRTFGLASSSGMFCCKKSCMDACPPTETISMIA